MFENYIWFTALGSAAFGAFFTSLIIMVLDFSTGAIIAAITLVGSGLCFYAAKQTGVTLEKAVDKILEEEAKRA